MRLRLIFNLIISGLLVANQFFLYPVYADEYNISGNGDNSSNSVQIQKDNSTVVHQDNDAQVTNEVKTDSNTGGNEANDNKGDANIETGDANTEVKTETSANTNQAQVGCCPTDLSSASVVDNGSNSSNQITHSQNTSTNIDQNNNVRLKNNIQITANTGDNEASNNSGDVSIRTGEVKTSVGVSNNLNASYIAASSGSHEYNLKISGNDAESKNLVNNSFTNQQEFTSNNFADINNDIFALGNTGGNKANNNNGKVFISTGNVYLDIILNNKVNVSKIIADCGCKTPSPSPTPTPSGSPSPSSPPSGGGSNSGGGSSGGGSSSSGSGSSDSNNSSAGQVLGVTLPVTGGFSIWQATAFALTLLLIGIMLRLDYAKIKDYFESLNYNFTAPTAIYLLTYFKGVSVRAQAQFARRHAYYIYT